MKAIEKIVVGGRTLEHTVIIQDGFRRGQPRCARRDALQMIIQIQEFPGAWETLVSGLGLNSLLRRLLTQDAHVRLFAGQLSWCDGVDEWDWSPGDSEWSEC